MSKFTVHKNLLRSNLTLQFPEYLYVSRNYFHLQWMLRKSFRRLKNVIMIMEWTPASDGENKGALFIAETKCVLN